MAKDGRRIKTLHPMDKVSPYIMLNRVGAMNLMKDSIDVEGMEKYIKMKRDSGLKNFGVLHVFLAAYTRMLAERPGVNRFIRGNKVYARKDGVVISMMIKKTLTLNAPETNVKLCVPPDASPDLVYTEFQKLVEQNKETDEDSNGFDSLARILHFIPGFLLKLTIKFLRLLDNLNIAPYKLRCLSPFHASMFITSMGSLGVPPIFHHLYDFGNIPVFIAYGKKYSKLVLGKDGGVEEKKFIDFTASTDDRICDGHYFASAFKILKDYLTHPEKLEAPAEVKEDIR